MDERIGGITLARLSPAHIQAPYADMERDGISARIRQLTHAVLRRALKQAVRWRLLVWNSCDAGEPPRVVAREVIVLEPEQVHILLDAAKGQRLEALCMKAVTTGMRMGELFGLHWPNVDLSSARVQVR